MSGAVEETRLPSEYGFSQGGGMWSRLGPFRFNSFVVVLGFTLCQVIGAMCMLPNLSLSADQVTISEEGMVCPMDSGTMCSTSLTSTPDRQIKLSVTLAADGPVLFSIGSPDGSFFPTAYSRWRSWPLESFSPLFSSSSVLRI